MGSNDDPSEKPSHRVENKSFAISKFPVTGASGTSALPPRHVLYTDGQELTPQLRMRAGAIRNSSQRGSLRLLDKTPASERSRMGVRGARGHEDKILVG